MDREVVERAQRGDRDAYASIAHAYGDSLFALAQRMLRDIDAADDAMQQTLVIAWRQLPRLRDPEHLDAWLRRILVRCCYEEARRNRRVQSLTVEPAPASAGFEIDDRDQLERGFRRLPPDLRAILTMHHYLGLSSVEIAETLGIPAGTARSRLHYAHQAMRAALDAVERGVPSGGAV
jgi:RNA polymerase sigma-70 factor (ECF subfamily)